MKDQSLVFEEDVRALYGDEAAKEWRKEVPLNCIDYGLMYRTLDKILSQSDDPSYENFMKTQTTN